MFLLTCVFYKGKKFFMKVTSINYTQPRSTNNNPNFKGITQGLVDFWQFVDNGGRALQFTVEDMTGTNIPRSVKGLLAGKKYTGHYNIPAFLQEAIREFLTGPTMCLVPFGVITLAKKIGGKSANIETKNMRNLSYLLSEKTVKQEGQSLEDAFYHTVVKDMLDKSTEKDVAQDAVDGMVELFKKLGNNTDKKEEGNILGEIQNYFEGTVKSLKDDYKETSFLDTKYTTEVLDKQTGKQVIGSNNVRNYANYATSYIKDITKKFGETISKEQIRNFCTSKQAYRLFTTIGGMIMLTGVLMCQIPKIYTKVTGLVNPNARAIYDEAKKNDKTANAGDKQ